jgi:hypothetical protein
LAKPFFCQNEYKHEFSVKVCPKNYGYVRAQSKWPNVRKIAESGHPGTDIIISKIFLPKNIAKKLAFLTQNKPKLCKILIITLFFEKNAIFSPKIGTKSPKIVIVTSTPGYESDE